MLTDDGSGAAGREVVYHSVEPSERGWAADSLALKAPVEALRLNGAQWRGRFVVFLMDNLGNVARINKGRAERGTRAHALLSELYALADQFNIDFVALWLPRAANQLLDAFSKCRTDSEIESWAASRGLRLRHYARVTRPPAAPQAC